MPIVFRRSIPKGFKVKTGTVIPEAEGWYREHLNESSPPLEIGVRSQESGVRRKEEEGRRKEPEEVFLQI